MSQSLPDVDSIGVDTRLAREMREAILSDEAIPPSGRNCREHYGAWDRESLIEYGQWLCALLQLQPDKTTPLSLQQFENASKLGLGPSTKVLVRVLGGVRQLQQELGFHTPLEFRLWSRDDYVRKGKRLAIRLGHRPTRNDLLAAYGRKRFPSERELRGRFGSISNFHEFIGYPSVREWEEDDFLDWGIAFKRQNGPVKRIGKDALDFLSKAGRGPSDVTVIKKFGGLPKFDRRVTQEYWSRIDDEGAARAERLRKAGELVSGDDGLAIITDSLDTARYLQVVGQYRLAMTFAPVFRKSRILEAVQVSNPDIFARWLVESSSAPNMAHVETTAASLDVFDDLWPMYRFQNVELGVSSLAA